MKKELIIYALWLFIVYLLIAFVVANPWPMSWHWTARLVLVMSWLSGVGYLEKK